MAHPALPAQLVQAQLAEDLVVAYLVQPLALAAQVQEVLSAPVDQQDLQQVDLEAALALIMELEAPHMWVHLEASVTVR